ncbi:MAG: DEAD/DEAH box helicase family protein [Balneola sp.]
MINFNDLEIKRVRKYGADRKHKPLELYRTYLPYSKKFCLKLGYFSTNAIFPIATCMASFIAGGGKMSFVINHMLRAKDKEFLNSNDFIDNEILIQSALNNERELAELIKIGSEHFFSCLKYLKKNGQLTIQSVKTKEGEMSHYKEGLFIDSKGNKVSFNGSCNFTYKGLVENGESISAFYSWDDASAKETIDEDLEIFQSIINKENKAYKYLSVSEIEAIIDNAKDKDEEELIQDEQDIISSFRSKSNSKYYINYVSEDTDIFEYSTHRKNEKPKFPFPKPHEYQTEAYKSWIANNYSAIFAMATGTGKTVTSLNCLLEEYRKNPEETYRAFILVPTITLVEQWEEEARKFNFKNIIKISSKTDWRQRLGTKLSSAKRISSSFIVICTYATFAMDKFQKYVKQIPVDTLFIADEAHNMGANSVLNKLDNINLQKKIGLSATPKRIYDEDGTKTIESFFHDKEPYTVNYSMERAINNDVLTKYDYYPHIVKLTSEELEEYIELTKKIARQYFIESSINKNSNLERLLLQRKRIIHKASNKLSKAVSILKKRYEREGTLKYTFVYVPEGMDPELSEIDLENEDEARIINKYIKEIALIDESILVNKVVGGMSNRQKILDQFERGDIQVLTSMKCLDEGVDVPRAEHAIFCSSTGNPRQFIQRRGRVLRKHRDKTSATVHDLVVIPLLNKDNKDNFEAEKNLVRGELQRVMYFASLSKNPLNSFEVFSETCKHYDIDMYSIFNELKDD